MLHLPNVLPVALRHLWVGTHEAVFFRKQKSNSKTNREVRLYKETSDEKQRALSVILFVLFSYFIRGTMCVYVHELHLTVVLLYLLLI